ncbi:receptor [Chamberlinius hualienensis]
MSWQTTTTTSDIADFSIDEHDNNSNFTTGLTASISYEELLRNFQQYVDNRAVDKKTFTALIATYSILIITGATGNGLVCLVVLRKPLMRTARNIFIINLAISDLLLCLFTMPFSLAEILLKTWTMSEFMCKLVITLQATSIYVSTMSITAIALDRYNVIVYPTREWTKKLGAVATLTAIWLVALFLSLPLYIVRKLDIQYVGLPQIEYVAFCFEEWPTKHGRGFYSIASMIFQYFLPIITVSVAYARICKKLKHRTSVRVKLKSANETDQNQQNQRVRKTNLLLISIALIFGISWLPLNIFNLVTDWHYEHTEHSKIVFASCHVMGMSSACSNPLLYGWLNNNFRKEFKEVFAGCCGCFDRFLSRLWQKGHDSSPVPLVIYTKQPLVAQDGQIATYSKTGDDDNMTVVTQISPPNS